MVNYLLEKYFKDLSVAEYDSPILRYMQSVSMAP